MASTGLFNNELILPGVITEIIPDYTQDYDTSEFGTTESVTIIGTAFNGPVGTVVPIYSPEHAKYIFGDSFDSATRREATLVAEVFDAWNRGCRTIYGVRISGKEIYKDYEFATETNLKLRVSGIFPSNENKKVFMNFCSTQGENGEVGSIKIYKPSDRSNMKEKMQGVVFNQNLMIVSEIKLSGYGITKDSRLVDVIDIINGLENNNVLRLSIVNENGADVTSNSKDAQSLSLGVMFPGIYTIGRDKATENVTLKTEINYALSKDSKPFAGYTDLVWKELIVNSDVAKPYPIYSKTNSDLMSLFGGISVDAEGEWLKNNGAIDNIASMDTNDYEEVELDDFDLYKRLGSGFAQTAQIVEVKNSSGDVRGYKVVVPNSNDINRVQEISDGIYSILQNHSTDYTVMANANAETVINGKLPRKDSFRKRKAGVIELKDTLTPVLELTCVIDEKDFSEALDYKIELTSLIEGISQEDIVNNINTEKKYERIACITNLEEGTKIFEKDEKVMVVTDGSSYELKIYRNGSLVPAEKQEGNYVVEIASELKVLESNEESFQEANIEEGHSIIASCVEYANVYMAETTGAVVKPVAVLSEIIKYGFDEDYTICFVEKVNNSVNVKIFSTEAQWMNYDELASTLNANEIFNKIFKVSALTPDVEVASSLTGEGKDKGDTYFDTSLYIPYTTSDNFARHLAQHCLYTSLKTYPTHGIMGCAKLNGVNLSTVADRVNQILELDLDLYAKRGNGNNMLNNNNVPYPIGRCLSVPFIQYNVTTGNGYNYVSNGSAGYAGMVSKLPAERSSTNQPIDLDSVSFELSNYQLSRLTAKGIVTVKKTTQGLVVTDGITMAPSDSAYRRLTTTKVVNIVDRTLRSVIEPYIGLQDNLSNKNSLNTAINSVLTKLQESLISYYEFKIVTDQSSSKLGIININYTIIPYNEIKEVRNSVSVQQDN